MARDRRVSRPARATAAARRAPTASCRRPARARDCARSSTRSTRVAARGRDARRVRFARRDPARVRAARPHRAVARRAARGRPLRRATTSSPRSARGAIWSSSREVMFNTGQRLDDLPAIVARGARGGRDACCSTSTIRSACSPVDVAALDVDFAVGGSYKYLRGGPGACFLYVAPAPSRRRAAHARHRLVRQARAVRYRRPDPPQFAEGGDAWLESTPPVLTCYQARAGQRLLLALGVARVRAYSLRQQRRLVELLAAAGRRRRQAAATTAARSSSSTTPRADAVVRARSPRAASSPMHAADGCGCARIVADARERRRSSRLRRWRRDAALDSCTPDAGAVMQRGRSASARAMRRAQRCAARSSDADDDHLMRLDRHGVALRSRRLCGCRRSSRTRHRRSAERARRGRGRRIRVGGSRIGAGVGSAGR